MPLPERQHYSIEEAAAHWCVSPRDVEDYIAQGLLRAETWVPHALVEYHRPDDAGQYHCFTDSFLGYAALFPETCQRVFLHGGMEISGFYLDVREHFFKLVTPMALHVTAEALVIRRKEHDRFAEAYGLVTEETLKHPGRPSVMPQILQEYERRYRAGTFKKSAAMEAQYLHHWAAQLLPGEAIPSAKTIQNNISLHRKSLLVNAA